MCFVVETVQADAVVASLQQHFQSELLLGIINAIQVRVTGSLAAERAPELMGGAAFCSAARIIP